MKSEPHYSQLDYKDRETIAISLQQGLSMRAIASADAYWSRSPSKRSTLVQFAMRVVIAASAMAEPLSHL